MRSHEMVRVREEKAVVRVRFMVLARVSVIYLDRVSCQITKGDAFIKPRIQITVESRLTHIHGDESGGGCHGPYEEKIQDHEENKTTPTT